jgi:hypothetical protein
MHPRASEDVNERKICTNPLLLIHVHVVGQVINN